MKTSRLHSRRGSAMIVALIISAVVAISLASYIRLGVTSQTISNRALYNNAAMNLAENGLEEAMYSINKMVADTTYNWGGGGWKYDGTDDDSNAWQRFPSSSGTYTFDQNATGYVRVYVKNYKGVKAPTIITRATISLGGAASAPIEKWIEVTLAKTSRFANGLVAKDSILFKGNNVTIDSWNSEEKGVGTFTPYSAGVRNDNGSVGSISVSVDSVSVQNADVWGYVSTNNNQDPTKTVGNNGSVLGEDSVKDATWIKDNVDPNRVSTQFSANFDPVETPTLSSNIGTISASVTLGADGTTTTYTCTDIKLGGKDDLITVKGNVILIVTAAAGTQAISITGGNAAISINTKATLKIYTAGDIDIAGKGIINVDGAAKSLELNGTSTSTAYDQSIKIAGSGAFCGAIYAPNGDVKITGTGDMWGSVVAEDITLDGTAKFHYDEALANVNTGNPFRVSKWKELTLEDEAGTTSDRAGYRDNLKF